MIVRYVPARVRNGSNSQDTFWNVPGEDEIVEYVRDEDGKLTDRKRNRKIRYVKGESSIYADEQSEDAKDRVSPIIVQGNLLLVDDNQPNKMEYLEKCNYNASNEMRRKDVNALIRVYDPNAQRQKWLDKEERIMDAKYKVKELDLNELKAFLLVLANDPNQIYNINKMSPQEIRHEGYRRAEADPKRFFEEIGSLDNKHKLVLMQAISSGLVRFDKETNDLTLDDGMHILRAPMGINVIDYFLEKVKTDAAFDNVFDTIKDRMRVVDYKSEKVAQPEHIDIYAQSIDKASKIGVVDKKGTFYNYEGERYQGYKNFRAALKADGMKLFTKLLSDIDEAENPPTEAEE